MKQCIEIIKLHNNQVINLSVSLKIEPQQDNETKQVVASII